KRCGVHKPLNNLLLWQLVSARGGHMLLGYARVSKGEEQDTRMQEAALRAAGVERLFTERASGGRWDCPELHRLLDQLRPKDVVVVWNGCSPARIYAGRSSSHR